MEWINNPKDISEVVTDSWCGIRICPSKGYCYDHLCWVLYCPSND